MPEAMLHKSMKKFGQAHAQFNDNYTSTIQMHGVRQRATNFYVRNETA
jgi:hypothetical protein